MRPLIGLLVLVQGATASAEKPVFLDAGINVRHFSTKLTPNTAARVETSTSSTPAPESDLSYAGDLRFRIGFPLHTYAGVEGEFGALDTSGSNLWGGYLLAGVRGGLGPVALGAEVAAGVRAIRFDIATGETRTGVVEPRVHAELWISPSWTIGAIAGESISSQPVTMVGFYFGLHSQPYDGAR